MDRETRNLSLRLNRREVDARDESSPTGSVQVENGPARGLLLTPDVIEPDRRYPLITVFHGAGRQDELIAKGLRDEASRRDALFFIPRSVQPTWDLIVGGPSADLEFLEFAWDLIYRRYPIDFERHALMGYSDGASYALSIGLSNPQHFSALIAWAAGFVLVDSSREDPSRNKPRIYLEYGSHDELFPFERVAVPMRTNLEEAGLDVTFCVDEGGRHWPSGSFQREALDWFFDGTPRFLPAPPIL